MNVFISSTYEDLKEYREKIIEIILRINENVSAMEFFGSRTDDPVSASKKEILECDYFIGIYAWRYGWQPDLNSLSISEQEFDYARECTKKCLCYLVMENFPWPPEYIDQGKPAILLAALKSKASKLVRSKFTTPDNLTKQIVADIFREMYQNKSLDSFGGLLRVYWNMFSDEVKNVFEAAYKEACKDYINSDYVIVSTRHVLAALASIPSSGRFIVNAYPQVKVRNLSLGLKSVSVEKMFTHEGPVSHCVLDSMERLLPQHSTEQRLSALELAVDLLKHGTGRTVSKYHNVGIDERVLNSTIEKIKSITQRREQVLAALRSLHDKDVLYLANMVNIQVSTGLYGNDLCKAVLDQADRQEVLVSLVGEMLQKFPWCFKTDKGF